MKSRSVPYPTTLPPLTFDLQKFYDGGMILPNQSRFIAFWAKFLLPETGENPTRQDYMNIATTIVETFPALRGGNNNNVINISIIGIINYDLSVDQFKNQLECPIMYVDRQLYFRFLIIFSNSNFSYQFLS